jgi:hypothetical protein
MSAAHLAVQSASSVEVLIVLAATAIAAFWKAIIKVLIAIVVIAVVVLVCSGALALVSMTHNK